MALRPSKDIKIKALLINLRLKYEFIVIRININDITIYKDVVTKLRKAKARLKG
jgi:hypothetical protein